MGRGGLCRRWQVPWSGALLAKCPQRPEHDKKWSAARPEILMRLLSSGMDSVLLDDAHPTAERG
jgi:hypothetical protein